MTNLGLKRFVSRLLRVFFFVYIFPTSLLGMYLSFNDLYLSEIHPHTAVAFKNGFIFAETSHRNDFDTALFYPDNTLAVRLYVMYAQEAGDYIYGYRKQRLEYPSHETVGVYFICAIGKSCADTQNLTASELKQALHDRGLPPYKVSYFSAFRRLLVAAWLKKKIWPWHESKQLGPEIGQ